MMITSLDCATVSFEELFAGKVKVLMDRSASRDHYDVFKLAAGAFTYDAAKLRKALILFGLTCDEDGRKKDFKTIQKIDRKIVAVQLLPLLRSGEQVDVEQMKATTARFLSKLLGYEHEEHSFMDHFLDDGIFEPGLICTDPDPSRSDAEASGSSLETVESEKIPQARELRRRRRSLDLSAECSGFHR